MCSSDLAQFSKGFEKFNQAYESGLISKVFATNLCYRPPALLASDWFCDVNVSKYLSLLIDGLNHNAALSNIINPTKRISELLDTYKGVENG